MGIHIFSDNDGETAIREAWSPSARAASAAARRGGKSNAGPNAMMGRGSQSIPKPGQGGIGTNADGSKMDAAKAKRQQGHIKAGYARKAALSSSDSKVRQKQHIKDSYAKKAKSSSDLSSSDIKSLTFKKVSPSGWNEQSVSASKNKITYNDYDEGKAEGDTLEFKRVGKKWKATKAESAYGFSDHAGKDIRPGNTYTREQVIIAIQNQKKNRSSVVD